MAMARRRRKKEEEEKEESREGKESSARAKERRNYFREGTLLSLLRGEVTFKLVAICRDGVQLLSNGVRTCSRHKIPNNKRIEGQGGNGGGIAAFVRVDRPTGESRRLL